MNIFKILICKRETWDFEVRIPRTNEVKIFRFVLWQRAAILKFIFRVKCFEEETKNSWINKWMIGMKLIE